MRDSNLYFVAHELHMFVADVEARMTYREFCGWLAFLTERASAAATASAAPTMAKGPNMMTTPPAVIAAMFKGD